MAVFLTALAVIVAAALIPYAYANAVAAKRKLPIYCTDRADKVVSLTFDAAWGDADTEELIAILDRYQVKATFSWWGNGGSLWRFCARVERGGT